MLKLADLQNAFSTGIHTGELDEKLLELIEPAGKIENRVVAFEIYQGAYQARLIEALGEIYEVFWEMVGDDTFYSIAGEYFRQNPSMTHSLSFVGEKFPEFVEELLTEHPILAEVADFERLFERVFHLPRDQREPPQTFDVETVIELPKSLRFQTYQHDIYQLWREKSPEVDRREVFLTFFRNRHGNIQIDIWERWQWQWLKRQQDKPSQKMSELEFGDRGQQDIQELFQKLGQTELILPPKGA